MPLNKYVYHIAPQMMTTLTQADKDGNATAQLHILSEPHLSKRPQFHPRNLIRNPTTVEYFLQPSITMGGQHISNNIPLNHKKVLIGLEVNFNPLLYPTLYR